MHVVSLEDFNTSSSAYCEDKYVGTILPDHMYLRVDRTDYIGVKLQFMKLENRYAYYYYASPVKNRSVIKCLHLSYFIGEKEYYNIYKTKEELWADVKIDLQHDIDAINNLQDRS